ncbi:cytochrome p450 [Moniliophthora roreri]|nr:cytochrome p450 [Moniliophthora roreri]
MTRNLNVNPNKSAYVIRKGMRLDFHYKPVMDSATLNLFPPMAKDFISSQSKFALLAALIASVLIIRQVFSRPKGSLPPGPKGLPVVGNLFQLSQEAWHIFTEWKKQYVAADLLDRRGPIYSNRPRWIVASEILTGGLLVVFIQYNDVWRRMRRAGHEGLNKTVAASFQVPQYREAISLVDGMIKRPQLWNAEIRRATASMVWSVVYDKEPITDVMDPQVAAVNDFITRIVRAAFPGAHYVEYFTWMKHLPSWMAKWKRDAEEWYKKDSEMFEGLFLEAKQRVKSGEDRPSFAANLVRDTERHGLSDRESAWLAAALYAAGAETTAGVLSWFMLAMVLYPDVQKKIHEELDAVVGRDRMPTFADLDRLHYVQATVREALRWHPVGLPHQSTEDDWYEGHFIPKGTICIANVWALNRDVEAYGADAADFNPGRFLDKNGKIMPALADTKEANIRPVKDAQGKPVMPIESVSINDGLVVRPLPFDCDITYRFPEAEGILAQTKELVESER